VHGLNGGDAFFNKMGATVCERTFCGEGSCTAWLLTVGPTAGVDPESYVHSKYIVIWACNSISTNLHHWDIVLDAKKKGAKVVVIDAYKSRTAKRADWHIAPKPGSDGALAMAIINSIIEQDLVDKDYVENYTVGFEALAERAKDRTPEWAEAITGVPAADIRKLAKELATEQPAAIRMGVALERHYGGGQTIRAVTSIPALTGAWRHVGGGVTQFPVWEHPYKFDVICRPDWIPEGTRVVSNLQIGRALTGRLLFAHECTFVQGVARLDQLPPDTLPEVAFAGRSNVGKSSLVNALTGRRTLARTSQAPGRTRQINFFALGGRLMLADLPGYGYARASKAEIGRWTGLVRDYLRGRARLQRVCLLVDARHGFKAADREAKALLDRAAVSYQVVLTKCDKLKPGPLQTLVDGMLAELDRHPAAYPGVIATSARDGTGIAELRASLAALATPHELG